jgi:hypothetical protein
MSSDKMHSQKKDRRFYQNRRAFRRRETQGYNREKFHFNACATLSEKAAAADCRRRPADQRIAQLCLCQEFDVVTSHSRPHAWPAPSTAPAPHWRLVDLGLPPIPHRPDEGFA